MARTLAQQNPERANRLIFLGALLLAAIAAVLVFVALGNFGDDGGGGTLTGDVDVVVASHGLPAGTKISASDLELATFPSQNVIDGALTNRDELTGFTTLYPMAKGDQFALSKLVEGEPDAQAGLAYSIPANYRAIAISVDADKIVGGHLRVGDRVDVIAVYDVNSAEGGSTSAARVLMQDIEVLAVADTAPEAITRFDEDGKLIVPEDGGEARSLLPSEEDPNPDADTITLAVESNLTATLALAAESGTIYVALRPKGATDGVDSEPVSQLQ
ncbi:MAG: Flp pilus assembly protein CpaB [Dehalococcoidia bacterium]